MPHSKKSKKFHKSNKSFYTLLATVALAMFLFVTYYASQHTQIYNSSAKAKTEKQITKQIKIIKAKIQKADTAAQKAKLQAKKANLVQQRAATTGKGKGKNVPLGPLVGDPRDLNGDGYVGLREGGLPGQGPRSAGFTERMAEQGFGLYRGGIQGGQAALTGWENTTPGVMLLSTYGPFFDWLRANGTPAQVAEFGDWLATTEGVWRSVGVPPNSPNYNPELSSYHNAYDYFYTQIAPEAPMSGLYRAYIDSGEADPNMPYSGAYGNPNLSIYENRTGGTTSTSKTSTPSTASNLSQSAGSAGSSPSQNVVSQITSAPAGKAGTVNLSLVFQGISKQPKSNKMNVQVTLVGPNSQRFTQSSVFTASSSGVWSGHVSLNAPTGSGYYVLVKGPKHIQERICDSRPVESSLGTYTCGDGNITLTSGANNLDFSRVVQRAGDLPNQNGVIDSYDIGLIRNNIGSRNPAILAKADLNLDGVVDSQDYSLLGKTVESLKN